MSAPDFQPQPPPPMLVQAEALRAAFPDYSVSVIAKGDESRFEVVAREGPGAALYCLISGDVLEIWRELRSVT